MSFEGKALGRMGTCIFPIQGSALKLCGEPTLLNEHGDHTPFCSKHANEIPKIFKEKLAKKGKRRSFRGKGFMYK